MKQYYSDFEFFGESIHQCGIITIPKGKKRKIKLLFHTFLGSMAKFLDNIHFSPVITYRNRYVYIKGLDKKDTRVWYVLFGKRPLASKNLIPN